MNDFIVFFFLFLLPWFSSLSFDISILSSFIVTSDKYYAIYNSVDMQTSIWPMQIKELESIWSQSDYDASIESNCRFWFDSKTSSNKQQIVLFCFSFCFFLSILYWNLIILFMLVLSFLFGWLFFVFFFIVWNLDLHTNFANFKFFSTIFLYCYLLFFLFFFLFFFVVHSKKI